MTRRSALAAIFCPLAALAAKPASQVRLTGMEIIRLPVNKRGDWILIRLQTDAGVTGIGDASHGRDEVTIAGLKQLFDQMRGQPCTAIEKLRKLGTPLARPAGMTGMSGACALSAIEQAMWDIAGQVHGVPVYELFGGALHTRIRNYANINRSTFDRSPSGFAKWAERAVADGFDAIKLASYDGFPQDAAKVEPHIALGTECVMAVRKAIGPKADLLIDAHSNFSLERGLQLARELEPANLFWLEEVCRGIPNLARINEAARMPTAGGESIFGVEGFYPYIAGKAADIMMPDVKYCGGMAELKKISAMAQGAGLTISPHGPASPVGNVAAAHVCVTLPNFLILELGYGEVPWRAEVVDPVEPLSKGHYTLSDRPGFGFRLNDKLLAARGQRVTV